MSTVRWQKPQMRCKEKFNLEAREEGAGAASAAPIARAAVSGAPAMARLQQITSRMQRVVRRYPYAATEGAKCIAEINIIWLNICS